MIEKLSTKECVHILENNYIGNLSYIYQKVPHVVPITYFFDKRNNILLYYSAEGQKINAMRRYDWVSMLVTEIKAIDSWHSVLVYGKYYELDGLNAKVKLHDFSLGVKELIRIREHKEMSFIDEFSSKSIGEKVPIVFEIRDLEITGRKRLGEFTDTPNI